MNLEDNQNLTFQEKVEKFITLLKQEVLNPDILSFESALYNDLLEGVREQNARIKEYVGPDKNGGGDSTSHIKNLKQQIYRSETEKIQYLLKEYLRTRLSKIQKHCFHLYKNQSIAERRLSESEKNFLRARSEQKFKGFSEAVLGKIPKHFRNFGGLETFFSKDKKKQETKNLVESKQSHVEIVQPNLQSSVYCVIKENPEQMRLNTFMPIAKSEENYVIPMNSIIFASYSNVSELVEKHNAELI